MKQSPIVRIAAVATAIASALACNDVYENNLLIGPPVPSPPVPDQVGPAPLAPAVVSAPPVCPASLDAFDGGVDGGTNLCLLPNAVCEYGPSSDRQCNQVYACGSGNEAVWRLFPTERCAADQCPKNEAISAIEGQRCGVDGGIDDGDEVLCNMSDGVCACTTGRGGSDVHERRWTCTKPLAQCPVVRPNIGQPCTGEPLCDYGSCRSKRGVAMTCLGGVWAATSVDCPQ